jgi:hypothetical protein
MANPGAEGPRAPYTYNPDESFLGEGPLMRTPRRRVITVVVVILVVLLAAGGLLLQRWSWSRELDPSLNARTGLADGAYELDVTGTYRGDGDCWMEGPVRGQGAGSDVRLYGTGDTQCARSGDYVGHVFFTVTAGRATITRVKGY